jgi:hypothetical protein
MPNGKAAFIGHKVSGPPGDDGDALRLAAKLGVTVDFNYGTVRDPRGELLAVSEIDIEFAILRAAAEIGKRVEAPLVRAV